MLSPQFLSVMQSSLGPEPSSPFRSVPVSMPVSDSSGGLSGPHFLSEKAAPRARASRHHRASSKGWGPRPPDSPQCVSSSSHPGQGVLWGRGNHVEPSGTLREQEDGNMGRGGWMETRDWAWWQEGSSGEEVGAKRRRRGWGRADLWTGLQTPFPGAHLSDLWLGSPGLP